MEDTQSTGTTGVPFQVGDPRLNQINRGGRPTKEEQQERDLDRANQIKKNNRELRTLELISLMRRLKPNVSKAVNTAVKILDSRVAKDADKLKASALILTAYKDTIGELYPKAYDDEEGTEISKQSAPPAPVFSLRVLNNAPTAKDTQGMQDVLDAEGSEDK